ncbi:hypothetical protein ACH437_13940 [Streptomyces xinghaiensis]|uniref:hypothetical protein n=1 Tax=Streptomyces xinghaiensis TaxID=1038928 RepID=UPI0037B710E6
MRLLDDVYSFAATGPRTSAGWQKDALAVMNREVGDPRRWITLDWDKEKDGEPARSNPSFPFVPLSDAELTERLSAVTAETSARLLVMMTYEWGPPGTEGETRAASADARTVLDRFGDRISCYSNIAEARTTTPSPDLTTRVAGWNPLTEYDGDFGVVVVSAEEVGVFWSFNPI